MARIAFLGIALILVLASAVPPTVAAQPALPATMYSQAQVDQAGTVIRFDLDPGQAGGQQAITVAPGAMVSGLMEWQAWGANPGEIGQVTLVYSWGGLPVTAYTCIFDAGIGAYPGQHRTDSFSFTAPAVSGTYYIWVEKGAQYSCSQHVGWISALPPSASAIGIVVVEGGGSGEGALLVTVRDQDGAPVDTSIWVDGQHAGLTGTSGTLLVRAASGSHRVVAAGPRDGCSEPVQYADVSPGQTTSVELAMTCPGSGGAGSVAGRTMFCSQACPEAPPPSPSPLSVVVGVSGLALSTTSGADGAFLLDGVPVGNWELVFSDKDSGRQLPLHAPFSSVAGRISSLGDLCVIHLLVECARPKPLGPGDYARPGEEMEGPITVYHPAGTPNLEPKTFELYFYSLGGSYSGILVWDPAAEGPVKTEELAGEVLTLYMGYLTLGDEAGGLLTIYENQARWAKEDFDLAVVAYSVGILFGGSVKVFETVAKLGYPALKGGALGSFISWCRLVGARMEEIAGVSAVENAGDALDYLEWLESGRQHWELFDQIKKLVDLGSLMLDATRALTAIRDAASGADIDAAVRQMNEKLEDKVAFAAVKRLFTGGLEASIEEDLAILMASYGKYEVSLSAQGSAGRLAEGQAYPADIMNLYDAKALIPRLYAGQYDFMQAAETAIVEKAPLLAWLWGIDGERIEQLKRNADQWRQQAIDEQVSGLSVLVLVLRQTEDHLERARQGGRP